MPIKFDAHQEKVEADHDAEVASAIADIVANLPKSEVEVEVQSDPLLTRAETQASAAPTGDPVSSAPAAAAREAPPPAQGAPASIPSTSTQPAGDQDRGMLRLLEREGQVRDRELALERAQRAFETARTEAESAALDRSRILAKFEEDPEEAMRLLGVDPTYVGQRLLAKSMGDKAPPELRRAVELDPLRREIAALRAERERERDAAVWAAERKRVEDGSREFSTAAAKPGDGQGTSKYPELARVASTDPDFVTQEIYNEIARDAAERGVKEPGKTITPEAAAERLNKRWGVFSKAFSPAPPAAAPAQTSTNVTPTPAQNAQAPAAAPTKPAAPPPRKPYWARETDVEREAALNEAVKIAKGLIPPPTA